MTAVSLTWDTKYQLIYGLSWVTVVVSALSIVAILIHLEATNFGTSNTMMELDTENPLALSEEDDQEGQEEKKEDHSPRMEIENSPSAEHEKNNATSSDNNNKPRRRRVRRDFKLTQLISVSVLVLLTYLLLVVTPVSNPVVSFGASFCVWVVFMRYPIGQELRRKRLDRLLIMLSLFLVIAAALSMATFSYKSLEHGEIYEGPARIVGYDPRRFNNSKHEPMMRTDLTVEFGYEWACPQTPSTYCRAPIEAALCQYELPDREQHRTRGLAGDGNDADGEADAGAGADETTNDLEQQLEDTEKTEEELEQETSDLEEQNEELKEEIEELENQEAEEEAEAEAAVEETEEEAEEAVEDAEEVYQEEEEAVEEYTEEVVEEYDEATEEYYPDYQPDNTTQTEAPTLVPTTVDDDMVLWDDYWYEEFEWDYTSYEFEDDYYESEYWDYDGWDDMWGEYT